MLIYVFLTVFLVFLIWKWFHKSYPNQPPGPVGLPLLGHLLFLGFHPAKKFLQWKKKFGPVFLTKLGPWDMVILNDAKLIREAFAQKALSGRANLPIMECIRGKGIVAASNPGVPKFRQFVLHFFKNNFLGSNGENALRQVTLSMLRKFDENPCQPLSVTHLLDMPLLQMLWTVLFGEDAQPDKVVLGRLLQDTKKISDIPNIGTLLTFFIPWARHFIPYSIFQDSFPEVYGRCMEEVRLASEQCKKSRIPGEPRGIADAFLDERDRSLDPNSVFHDDENLFALCVDIFIGGVDTTSTSFEWAVFLLGRDERVQRKLQEEIDRVWTSTHSLEDRAQMPYAEAVLQEVFRLSSVLGIGVFHQAIEDTKIRGYSIKRHQWICSNIYGAHMDPDVWENPITFLPERFLDPQGRTLIRKEELIVFSGGRRSCLGEVVARKELMLTIVSLFHRFNIKLVDPLVAVNPSGFLLKPPEFEVISTPR